MNVAQKWINHAWSMNCGTDNNRTALFVYLFHTDPRSAKPEAHQHVANLSDQLICWLDVLRVGGSAYMGYHEIRAEVIVGSM